MPLIQVLGWVLTLVHDVFGLNDHSFDSMQHQRDHKIYELELGKHFDVDSGVDIPLVRIISATDKTIDFWFVALGHGKVDDIKFTETMNAAADYCGKLHAIARYDGAAASCGEPSAMITKEPYRNTFVIAGYHCDPIPESAPKQKAKAKKSHEQG